jgi:hypothetical protein
MIKASIVTLVLIASLLCNIFLLTLPSSFTNTLSSIPHAYRALAFKPTNKNNNNTTPISKPPVTANHPPIVRVGPNQTVNENATVMLVGVAIDPDPTNDKLSYSWNQIAGTSVVLNGPNTASPTFTAPSNITSDTELKFALTAKDDKGAINNNPAITTITVKHINHPPVANAGTDQRVNAGYVVALDGSKSKDPDSDQLTYSWTQTTGPSVTLSDSNASTASFKAPNISSDTTLKFSLTVKDDKGATNNNPAIVSVAVKAAVPVSSSSAPTATLPVANMTSIKSNQSTINQVDSYKFVRKWGTNGTGDGQFIQQLVSQLILLEMRM